MRKMILENTFGKRILVASFLSMLTLARLDWNQVKSKVDNNNGLITAIKRKIQLNELASVRFDIIMWFREIFQ
jgi:hypothetical protein